MEDKTYKVPFKIEGYVSIKAQSQGEAVDEVSNYSTEDLIVEGRDLDIQIALGYREVKAVD